MEMSSRPSGRVGSVADWRATVAAVRTLLEEEGWVRSEAVGHHGTNGLVEERGHIVDAGLAIEIFHNEDGVDVAFLGKSGFRAVVTASNRYSDRPILRAIRRVIATERKKVNP